MRNIPSNNSKRRSMLKKMGYAFISMFIVRKNTQIKAGHCPGHVDCQGFVPPCKNCEDPNRWKSIALNRVNFYFQSFWTHKKS